MKMFSDGKLREDSPVFEQMRNQLRLKDKRTFDKHIGILIQLGWVGYNSRTGIYFIRSFDYVRLIYNFRKRTATTLYLKDIWHIQQYLVGVILSAEMRGQKYYWESVYRRKPRTATKKGDVAKHSKVYSEVPNYYGLSVKAIAELLGCRTTRASVLKQQAAKAGYIKMKHHFAEYATLTEADFHFRPNLNDRFPALAGKFRIKKVKHNGTTSYKVLVQLHDEIIPNLAFKTVSKFNNLQVAPAIVRQLEKLSSAKVA
jgi:hypothetical protein